MVPACPTDSAVILRVRPPTPSGYDIGDGDDDVLTLF